MTIEIIKEQQLIIAHITADIRETTESIKLLNKKLEYLNNDLESAYRIKEEQIRILNNQ